MSLSDLNVKKVYRTKQDDYVGLFLVPALKESTTYDRGAGYFSLASLAELADGLIPFIQHGGAIRVVTSVELSDADVEIIKKGSLINEQVVKRNLQGQIAKGIYDEDSLCKLDYITNLIAAGLLEIKIAYMPDGIYHEKIGLLTDNEGNSIYFSGSNNATVSGLQKNWETVMVLTSWWGDGETIKDQQLYFNNLWNDDFDGLTVMSFPEAEKHDLIRKYKASPDVREAIKRVQQISERRKKKRELYDYQKIAVQQFLENKGNHFYEMATGTGKTFTAIRSIISLQKKVDKLSAIVIVPQIDLQAQWQHSFEEEGVKPLLLGGYANANETKYNFGAFMINSFSDTNLNVAIATYDTLFAKIIKQCLPIGKQAILVIDEAHNLSPNQIRQLPDSFQYRLGLSATPERYSQQESDKIVKYFTRDRIETYKYTIDEAIENGFLSHYMYTPVFVNVSDVDFVSYQNYTKQVIVAMNQDPVDEALVKDILTKRSSIIKKSNAKLEKLEEMVNAQSGKKYNFKNSVVYCGHGKDYETEGSIIDSVTRILALQGRYSVSQFTSRTIDRARVLREFEDENYDVLVAIKCFDEGVDVPKLDKIYIMASDALSRQTIQRRGRVLRTCTETGKRMAYIYDFVALPPLSVTEGIGVSNLVVNEMKRAKEYARLADNKDDVMEEMLSIMKTYGVSEEDLENEFNTESE